MKVPALGKAVALMDAVAHEPGLTFTGIQERIGTPKSSTHHLISTMCKLGLIRERPAGGYSLGHKLLELASIAKQNSDLQRDAMPILKDFAKRVQLTCHLGILEQNEAIYIARVEGARDIVVRSHIGQRFPVYSSALGKSLVAWLQPELLEALIDHIDFQKRMPKTIASASEFRRHLVDVRRRGWALDDEEQASNCRCVAAPIRDCDGVVVASISAVGTLEQVDEQRIQALASEVIEAAKSISEAI